MSPCPSISTARSSRHSLSRGRRQRALAATRPPTMAAALLPSPRASGMRLRHDMDSGTGSSPAASKAARAARYTRLSSAALRESAPSPSTRTTGSEAALMQTSFHQSKAMPRQSKPGPRLAVVAGTRTETDRFSMTLNRAKYTGRLSGIQERRFHHESAHESFTNLTIGPGVLC